MHSRRLLRRPALPLVALFYLSVFSAQLFGSSLQQFRTVFGTDVAMAGVGGLRGSGNGAIQLSGISGRVTGAYLYWHGPASTTSPTANDHVFINGIPVSGENIGLAHDNCWGLLVSHAYRADLTDIVSALGNGTYALTGLSNNTNGASLVVFFQDGDRSNDRDVVIFNGNDSNVPSIYDGRGWNFFFSGILWSSGSAQLALHVSDGQIFADAALFLNGRTLAAAGPIFQGDSVPSDNSGPNGQGALWDLRVFDITSFLSPGSNSLSFSTGPFGDCLSLVAALIDLPAGTAPGERLTVDPMTPSNCVGAPQSLTAHLSGDAGVPIPGQLVTFQVRSGPNAGKVLTAVTDATGDAAVSYSSELAGTDQWQICTSRNGQDLCGFAWVEWKNCSQPPNVSQAVAAPDCLFPPNHQFVPVIITGVTDPDGDPVTITVTGVSSDEPTATILGAGGMHHVPDAIGVGTANVSLRAERSGAGDGRVYQITFVASDSRGRTSTGTVRVGVPHDQKRGSCPAIDSGQRYDATQ